MEQTGIPEDPEVFQTPPKAKHTFRRKNREYTVSPTMLRADKMYKFKDEMTYERIQVMIRSELSLLRKDIETEMYAHVETCKETMYADMRKELDNEMISKHEHEQICTSLKTELQNYVRVEVNVMECVVQKKLADALHAFESWKSNAEKRMNEKDALIEELKGELAACKNKDKCEEKREIQSEVIKELENIKEQVKTLRDGEEEKSKTASSWADVLTKTQQKVDEAEKWIEVEKKGKTSSIGVTPTSTIINMTIEEEQKRRTRALHVRITGLKDNGNVEEEVKGLLDRMGISEATHSGAWRVGKKGTDAKGNPKEKALIMRFPAMEARKEFLKKRSTLKDTGIFLGDDLTIAQVAHMQEVMPEIKAARGKGKIAFYRGGKVVILEKHTK